VIEMANKEDIQASIDLLTACVSELDQHDWKF
jgi:endoglucanase